jgi:hypothetical protein
MSEVLDLGVIKGMLETITQKQDAMGAQLRDIETDLVDLKKCVIGNPDYGQKGLVEQVATLNKFMDNEKIRNAKVLGGLGVIGIFWTLFLKFFK